MDGDYAIVYPVGGLSSRFGGKPKWFVRVGPNNETLIEYSINQAIKAGFNKIIFVVGEHTEKLFKDEFKDSYKGIPIFYTKQTFDKQMRDKPWGTVDALCSIREIIDCPFVFCNGDDIYGEGSFVKLIEHLKQDPKMPATLGYKLIKTVPENGTVHRGIFSLSDDSYVTNLIETFNIEKNKLDEAGLSDDSSCSMNIFAFNPDIVNMLNEILERFKENNKENRKIECLLPNEIGKLASSGKIKLKCYPTNEPWFGVTNPEDEEIVRKQLAEL